MTKYRWLSDTPRAHITNQRALEVLRDLGLEHDATLYGTPQELMGDNVFCTSLAGEELGRLRTWGSHPMSAARHKLASPTHMMDLPQNFLEPIVFGAACARGTKARLSTEYLSHRQDKTGVTSRVRDRVTGEEYDIRSKYLIGADGGNSQGRRGCRAEDARQDGRRRLDQHHLQGRPVALRRAPAERALLGHAARLRCRRHRHGRWCAWCGRGTNG